MRTLDLKVFRDALHLKGQLLAVAALVACGVAVFIMLRSMNGYLRDGQSTYYRDYAFGEVFAHAVRAPYTLEERLAAVPGVDRLYVRVVRDVLLDVPGLSEPATGRLVSVPESGVPGLNRLHLRSGRMVEPGRRDQVVVSAAFAEANGLRIGDSFGAVLNGRRQRVEVVGTAISPEFIYEVSGVGSVFPDNRRFGAMWMSRDALSAAFEMEGAFNDVVATLRPGASSVAVRAAFDDLLEPYGGVGSYDRDHHLSHVFVTSEIEETTVTSSFFPALFLLVTAFLLHNTMLRLVRMEREQIGLMKAFGFRSSTVARHYVELALIPVAAGGLVGTGLGIWLADGMAQVYGRFYQFPEMDFVLDGGVVLGALCIAVITGVAGAWAAARSVVKLAPAVAMAPPAPKGFRHARVERTGWWRAIPPSGRLIARNVLRARWKSISTAAGIGLALGVLVALLSIFDAIDVVADLQFNHVYREDVSVYFESARDRGALREVARLPGVLEAEPIRVAPVRLSYRHRERRASLLGLRPQGRLRRIVDADFREHPPPFRGLLMSRTLADRLGVSAGDTVHVEVTEGHRPRRRMEVSGLVDELMGGEVYVEAATLYGLLGEVGTVSGVWLRIDPVEKERLYSALKSLPGVSTVLAKDVVVRTFNETIQESFLIALTSTLVLGGALVMAIVYNQARVALGERGRELASLRVLGFSRREVATLLLGEQAVLVALALPAGLLAGWLLTLLIMLRFDADLFRLPVVADPGTYAKAVGIVLASATVSALLVRRRLDRIDLIAVLKTRE